MPMTIQRALEWAFATEKAQLDFDATGAHEFDRVGVDPIWRAMRIAEVGCVVDGGGSSDPHPDATIIAGAVEAYLPRSMALTVVEHARARSEPVWRVEDVRRVVPCGWDLRDDGRWTAATEAGSEVTFRDAKSRVKTYRPEFCPVSYGGGAPALAAARRAYLGWWGALLTLTTVLRGPGALISVTLTDGMPPLSPWKVLEIPSLP